MGMHRSDSLEFRRQQEAEAARKKREIQERTVFYLDDGRRVEPQLPYYDRTLKLVSAKMGLAILDCVSSRFRGYGGLMPDINNEWEIRKDRVKRLYDWTDVEYHRNRVRMFDESATEIRFVRQFGQRALEAAAFGGELTESIAVGIRLQFWEYSLPEDESDSCRGRLAFQTDQSVYRLVGDGAPNQEYVKNLTVVVHNPASGLLRRTIFESEQFDLAVSCDERQATNPGQLGIAARFVKGQRSVESQHYDDQLGTSSFDRQSAAY